MTIKEALSKGTIMLKNNNVESPKLKARLLLQYVLKQTRQYIIVYDNKEINKKEQFEYFVNIEKLTTGVPLQHITHSQEFMKMDFFVDENVLIPRSDTEILVEEVINISKKIKAKKILDLCTGSGAIAISLAKYIENSEITAVDISKKALEIARTNAKNNDVENQITFVESDLFKNLKEDKYDVIVSNPPYIKREVIKKLNKDVQKEPIIALDGGYDGLDFYRKIINESEKYLKFNGYLCFEIGYDQKEDVIGIIKNKERYINTYSKKDLYGNDRIIITKLS